jgi:flagellar M-ring protein FliF
VDALNRAVAQLTDLFHSMTIGARITTGLLLVMVVVSLGYLFSGGVAGPSVDLMHGAPLTSSDLQRMQAAFGRAKLSNYEIRGTQIFVPHGQQSTYMAALADAGALPANFGTRMAEAAQNSSPWTSSQQRQDQMKVALQEELALIVSKMSGIESAYVIYASESRGALHREKFTTASVGVKPQGDLPLDDSKILAIRHVVAGAVPGLKPENINIADLNSSRVYIGTSPDGGTEGENSLYLTLTRMNEKQLKDKILSALSYVPNVTVEPSIVLDPERIRRSQQIQHDPKAVAWKTVEQSSTLNRDSAAPQGRPGYVSNAANAPVSLNGTRAGNKEESEESRNETVNMVPTERVDKEVLGLTPKQVSVAVGIPTNYFEKVWQERNSEPGSEPKKPDKAALDLIAQEETDKIRRHVAGIIAPMLPAGAAEPTELVTVTAFQAIKPVEPAGPSPATTALSWLSEYWSTLAVIGVALVGLNMLRSLARSAPLPLPEPPKLPQPAAPRVAAGTTGEPGSNDDDPAESRLRRFQTGKSLRDELSDLVQEDPDVAANILKSWIGHHG